MGLQSQEKMVRRQVIKSKYFIHYILFLFSGLLLGCDPSHSLVLQNYSQSEVLFEVKIQDTLYFDTILASDSLFDSRIDNESYIHLIPIIKSDSNRYYFKLPSQHSVVLSPSGIGDIPIDLVIMEFENVRNTIFASQKTIHKLPVNVELRSSFGFMFYNRIMDIHDLKPIK